MAGAFSSAFSSALACVRSAAPLDLHLPVAFGQPPVQASSPCVARASRRRLLPIDRTLSLFVRQVAYGNVACAAVRHLAGERFTDSAWCQARARLPIERVEQVNRAVAESLLRELDESDSADVAPRWRARRGNAFVDHRVFVLDGTNDSMPDAPALRDHYGVPPGVKEGLGFPTSHLLMRMDHRAGLILDCIDAPIRRGDLADAPAIHAHLQPGDVVLADVAFSGYAHVALILRAQAHVVMPTHHKRIVDFTPDRAHAHPRRGKSAKRHGKPRSRVVRRLGHDDQLVEYLKPANKPAWMDAATWASIPQSMLLREVRRTYRRDGFKPIVVTLVTSLLDAESYPADDLVELRLTRWMIETSFRHLKITLGMDELKCKTVDGVRKERMVFVLVYNLIRALMLHAAKAQGVNPHRVSFADALAWLRYARRSSPTDEAAAGPMMSGLLVNPRRPGRVEPRVLKRAKKQFPYMTKPREALKSQLRAAQGDGS